MRKKSETAALFVPEAEQPYKIPDNWRWVKLSALVSPSKETTTDFSADIRYVGLEHMETGRGIVSYGNAESVKSVKNVFHDGQILYGKLRPYLNKHDIAHFSGVCSTDILVFKQNSYSRAKYVNYYFDLPYFLEYAVSHSRGIHLPRVTESILLNAACPLPPLAEQQRIVDRIESLFAKLDAAREKARKVIDGFELRKAAILYRAFNGELTAQWRDTNGVSADSWLQVGFESCVQKMQNGLAKRKGITGNPVVVLRLANFSDDGFVFNDLREIVLDEKERSLYSLNAGDILMIRVNGSKENVGKQFLITNQTEWAFCDHIIRIRCSQNIQPEYMTLFSKSEIYKQYVKSHIVSSAGQNTISRRAMADLFIPVPTIREQSAIVRLLRGILEKEKEVKDTAQEVIERIDTMKKAILGRAFRGELGTNDLSEASPDFSVTVR